EQARALRPSLVWNEDNPERLLRAIEEARSGTLTAKKPAAIDVGSEDAPAARSQQECQTLLREGRQQLKQSKFDEVSVILKRVRGYHAAKYGLFDDTPDKLQNDMARIRIKKDREESGHVLTQARQAFDEG